jgi:prepilin signal peptidase PulO-like enzyme (type II secretory pathway)
MSGIFTVCAVLQVGSVSRTWRLVPLLAALAFIIVSDLCLHVIPDIITLPSITYVVLLGLIAGLTAATSAIVGGAVAGGAILLLVIISRGGIGGGDFKLMALIGAAVGLKWAMIVFVLSQFVALGGALVLWVRDGRFFNRRVPIGAIIAALAVVVILSQAS